MNDPWKSFLTDLDAKLVGPTELHCLGGFVVAEHYGLIRATGDIDLWIEIINELDQRKRQT